MLKLKAVIQSNKYSCGAASIYIAVSAIAPGKRFTLKQIEKAAGSYSKDGLTYKQLMGTIKSLGFGCKEIRFSGWERLKKESDAGNPVIISWMPMHLKKMLEMKDTIGHYSVVEKVGKNYIIIADPDNGKKVKMDRLHFLRLWFDYDVWYPKKSSDIKLRWGVVVYSGIC